MLRPAAFGPDALFWEPPLESRPLIKARPRDGCTPFLGVIEDGGIALVKRGSCNFTQKVTLERVGSFLMGSSVVSLS